MSFIYKSRWYQTEAEQAIFNYFDKGNVGNPIIAMPTATGKSVVIANFIKRVLYQWPNQRIIMGTHVKKLITQNAEKLQSVWPVAPLGIYSAGLNSREKIMPIVFGGVQSILKEIERSNLDNSTPAHLKHFGWRDLFIIDECHLLSPAENTTYQIVISELKKINPYLKVIGFTATPYRQKQGSLTDDGIFTDICYDLTTVEMYNRLMAEGFLAPLIPRPTQTQIDLSNVSVTGGDFNAKQLEAAVDKDSITYSAVKEMIEYGYDRKCWIVFASGIDNSEHINSMLQSFGINSTTIHSKLKEKENDKRLQDWMNGQYLAIVSNRKLTTGIDHPPIDFIGHLMPTLSPGLWVQTLGRGTRPSPETGKENCLVLDFAGNTKRLGPINDPVKPRKPGAKGKPGDVPVRICESCGAYNHAAARICCSCGMTFSFASKLFTTASTYELIKSDAPIIELVNVQKVLYNLHTKENTPPSIKVSYFCGLQMYNEWICLEHGGIPAKKARDWWRQRHYEEPPPTTNMALQRVTELRIPTQIKVHVNKKYPEILSYEY
jgi:DNA repair protein RadD